MLRIDRLCVYVILLGLISLIPSLIYLKFLDELCAAMLGGIALLDCVVNGSWRRYRLLWLLMAIMTFYAIYSLTIVHNNVPIAIFYDWVIELKPYLPFIVLLCIGPKFTTSDKQIICAICWVNAIISIIALLGGKPLTSPILFHPMYGGCIVFISAMFILYCSIDKNGEVPRHTIIILALLLTAGLICGRSKYFGTYVLSIFFLFLYSPGIIKHLNLKHALLIAVVCFAIIAVAWSKFHYYFIIGTETQTSFDITATQSFARPVLYITSWFILLDYFPFGCGLASFASFPSQEWYSNVYYEYGINNVWGLSLKNPGFICDAFYPSLAQFGFAGLILFIWYWVYAYGFLRTMLRTDARKYKYPFIIGSLIICYILIESTTGNVISQNVGVMPIMLLGIVAAQGRELREAKAIRHKPVLSTIDIKKI